MNEYMMKSCGRYFAKFLLILFFLFPSFLQSQNLNYTILCVGAHPDDEDGAALAYYSRIKGYNAYTIFYTRGEGGQNEIGPELYDELGKIRERECYNAAGILRSKTLFLGFLDFGFSKTAKETFKLWGGKDSMTARLVYLIRLIRPDVIISNHDTITTKPNRQHGHHQAVGITVYEAYDKAADPSYHAEQLQNGVTPWQVKKLYFRVYDSTQTEGVVEIPIDEKDTSGKTIREISFEALAMHKTQGMDKIDTGSILRVFKERRYQLIRSDKEYPFDKNDLFSGIGPNAKLDVKPKSYETIYSYIKVNPEDSLRLLESLSYSKDVYIGLVQTYDNTLENTLRAFRINYELIDSSSLAKSDLSKYSTILLDIRGYFYRKDLSLYNSRLLEYIRGGGNIIDFYQKPGEWNGKFYAPYNIYLTSERVTEEDAKVTVLVPEHIFFNRPNEMEERDWNGWIQERNIYLPAEDTNITSSKYFRLLDMDDEDDTVPPTSLLYAKYGKGTYTYCSLALYRQLKIFNEGALKLFLNMISQSRN